jgi:HK97 family phage portal protein
MIREALAALVRQPRAASIESPAVPISSSAILDFIGSGTSTNAGVAVSETSALGMTAVWRAVNLISGVCAGLPLHAYKATDDEDVRERMPRTSAAARLLADPHPDMTSLEFWETVYAHICLWGNAYIRMLRNQNGQIVELWPIHPGRVRVGRESENGTKVYCIDGGETEHTDATILHIPGFGYDGVCGVSPIRFARQAIAMGLAAEQYGGALFGNGSLASGILQTEQRLEQDDANRLKKRWRDKATGLNNAHDVVVLDSGAKFQQLSIPPQDAQFIESRRFQIVEVARLYGIPPHMMMETDKSTSWGTGIEQQAIGFNVYDLKRYYQRVEQRLTRIIRPANAYASYNVEGLLRGDSITRADFYGKMFHLGALSTNEIRRKENLPSVEGGDTRYRELNLGELGAPDPGSDVAPAEDDAATVAETVQKVYLGVGPVLTSDEAREIVNAAGGNLPIPMPEPDPVEPAPAPAEEGAPADA